MVKLYLLYEAVIGFAMFEVSTNDMIGSTQDTMSEDFQDFARFSSIVTIVNFKPFSSAKIALDNINAISDNKISKELRSFLIMNLPKVSVNKTSKAQFHLGVSGSQLGIEIRKNLGILCIRNDITIELFRGIRSHFQRYIKLTKSYLNLTRLGLAHAYSRAKIKYNIKKNDTMAIQAITLMDKLEKDINNFTMKIREWYGWYFPELSNICNDDHNYLRILLVLKDKSHLSPHILDSLVDIVKEKTTAQKIIDALRSSLGQKICKLDINIIEKCANLVIDLSDYHDNLHLYLNRKMQLIAPNLNALVGNVIGARLIAHAGSLENLAKLASSTVQIIGAEKALFRSLKFGGNTPKHGLIFNSSFIRRVKQRNKGRISRYLANKCSIAARIDAFMDGLITKVFGDKLKEQVEDRIHYYEKGMIPQKNITVMREVLKTIEHV